jgi:heme/copper-type cytochrome/quinol oxidase subunit 4
MEPTTSTIPKMLVYAGIVLIILGLIYWLFQGKLSWLGRLPGDIRVEKENFSFYAPITTMILLSLVLNGVIWVIKKMM